MQVDLQRLILWVLGLGVALLLLTFVPYVLVLLVVMWPNGWVIQPPG